MTIVNYHKVKGEQLLDELCEWLKINQHICQSRRNNVQMFQFRRRFHTCLYLTFKSIFHKPSIDFSSIVKSRSNPFLEPISTKQQG